MRARVYSVYGSLRLYVSGRTRKRVGVERGEKAGERWNRGWERREIQSERETRRESVGMGGRRKAGDREERRRQQR